MLTPDCGGIDLILARCSCASALRLDEALFLSCNDVSFEDRGRRREVGRLVFYVVVRGLKFKL